MINWLSQIHTIETTIWFPRLIVISSETQTDASYHFSGKDRQNEHYCLFKYTLKGVGIFRDATGEHRVASGYGFLCRINDPATSYYYPIDSTEPWEFVYCAFAGESSFKLVEEMLIRYGALYQLDTQNPLIIKLLEYSSFNSQHVKLNFADNAKIVMDLLHTLATNAINSQRNEVRGWLTDKAIEFIRNNINMNITASDVAKELNISREHFSRVFKQQTSHSPFQYILRQKMILACRLLKETDYSIKEIAAHLNYDNSGHFGRSFKQIIGMTPKNFRETGIIPIE